MRDEISKLLEKEGILSKESLKELSQLDIHKFFDNVKELGEEKTEHIQKEKITKDLNTSFIGKEIYIFKEVMSTNTVAKFFAENKVSDGTVIISEKQTNAKGRSGKPWDSPLGGVWLSIILNPRIDYSKLPMITLATGVAVAKTLERLGIEDVEIKWPNDVLVSDKKIAGILCETVMRGNNFKGLVLGVGVNLNSNIENLSLIDKSATALNLEIGRDVNISDFLDELLEEFFKNYETFLEKGFAYIREYYLEKANFIGNEITIVTRHEKFSCLACDVNDSGELVVLKNGVKKFISAGDIL